MNNNHSGFELKYRPRWIAPLLKEAIKEHPIIVLTGARQVGKSTLLQQEEPFCNWRYITLDDFDVLAQARREPASIWAGTECIVIDEVQKSPNLLNAIKIIVNSSHGKYRFILSGSANLLLMKNVSESLAGRAVYWTLLPMTEGEINYSPPPTLLTDLFTGKFPQDLNFECPSIDTISIMWRGYMPALLSLVDSNAVLRWWEGYVTTYLERDLRQLSQIEFLPDFKRLMEISALRCGQILNQSNIAQDTGISQPTIHRYLNLLESTCLVQRLPAFTYNRTKRLVKSPKIIWLDPGLASFLCGHYNPDSLRSSKEAGGIFESMIYLHLSSLCSLLIPRPKIFYWRTTGGKEVDFVIEWGQKLLAIEVKMSDAARFSDVDALRVFIEDYPQTFAGILIYTGDKIKRLHDKIVAIPWQMLAC